MHSRHSAAVRCVAMSGARDVLPAPDALPGNSLDGSASSKRSSDEANSSSGLKRNTTPFAATVKAAGS